MWYYFFTHLGIISAIRQGFIYEWTHFKPNERIATILVLEYNLGLRVGDILQLRMNSFVRDGDRYRLDIYEQKTGKYRNFTIPMEIYYFVREYAYKNGVGQKARLLHSFEGKWRELLSL